MKTVTRNLSRCLALLLILSLAAVFSACGGNEAPPSGLAGDEDLAGWPELESLGDSPRPDRVRQDTALLTGPWDFAFDPDDVGLDRQWHLAPEFPETIQVPFCVESEASGVQETDPPDVVWYSRTFSYDAQEAGQALLHFGAVDYHAMVWLNGVFLGEHFGGYTPFFFEVGGLLQGENLLVVRVEDSLSLTRPRGKQSFTGSPYGVFYETVTGIWQPVWLERAGPAYLQRFRADPDWTTGRITIQASIAGAEGPVGVKAIAASPSGERAVAIETVQKTDPVQTVELSMAFAGLVPWSPDEPNLYSLRFVITAEGKRDVVDSYFGVRSIEIAGDDILLNGEYLYQRLILNQGYFAGGHYTPVSPGSYRRDIEIVKEFGFNGLRMHEKIESPQFLFWADFLGALVWEELPSAWWLSDEQRTNLEREWQEAIERDINHPAIITWVPFNESWGVGVGILPVILLPEGKELARYMHGKTREWDPTRIVIDNSGYDHTSVTDVVDVHHYLGSTERAAQLYDELDEDLYDYEWSIERAIRGIDPSVSNQNVFTFGEGYSGQPILISEYGGFGFYDSAEPGDVVERYRAYTAQIQAQPHIDGYCYTQFGDTYQERNGLLDEARNPKVPADEIRAINESARNRELR